MENNIQNKDFIQEVLCIFQIILDIIGKLQSLMNSTRIRVVDFIDSNNGFGIADDLFNGKEYLIKIKIEE